MFSVVNFSSAVAPRGSLVGASGCCQRRWLVIMEAAVSSQECLPVCSHVSQRPPLPGLGESSDSDESLFYVFICVGVHMHVPQRTFGD